MTNKIMGVIGILLIAGVLIAHTDAQRLPPESTQNIPVGSCFDNGQCWNGTFWVPKAVRFPRTWTIEGTSIVVTELQGVCIYSVVNNPTIMQILSKKDLPTGAGCQ